MKTYQSPNLTLVLLKDDIVRTSLGTDPGKNDIFYAEFTK